MTSHNPIFCVKLKSAWIERLKMESDLAIFFPVHTFLTLESGHCNYCLVFSKQKIQQLLPHFMCTSGRNTMTGRNCPKVPTIFLICVIPRIKRAETSERQSRWREIMEVLWPVGTKTCFLTQLWAGIHYSTYFFSILYDLVYFKHTKPYKIVCFLRNIIQLVLWRNSLISRQHWVENLIGDLCSSFAAFKTLNVDI